MIYLSNMMQWCGFDQQTPTLQHQRHNVHQRQVAEAQKDERGAGEAVGLECEHVHEQKDEGGCDGGSVVMDERDRERERERIRL
jgi:hypothetical protein